MSSPPQKQNSLENELKFIQPKKEYLICYYYSKELKKIQLCYQWFLFQYLLQFLKIA